MSELLEALIPSRARRAMLQILRWGEPLSLRQLARDAGVPYSAAHREAGRLAGTGLLKRTRSGRAWTCSWNPRHPAATALSSLLGRAPARAAASTADVVASLKRWGAPLTEPASSRRRLSLEEALAHAAALSRRRPELARVWPLVFAKHYPGIDLDRLAEVAGQQRERRALGFLMAVTALLLGDARLSRAASRLDDRRVRTVEDYFRLPKGARASRIAEQRTPALARRWRFRMNMSLESFASLFRKFRGPS